MIAVVTKVRTMLSETKTNPDGTSKEYELYDFVQKESVTALGDGKFRYKAVKQENGIPTIRKCSSLFGYELGVGDEVEGVIIEKDPETGYYALFVEEEEQQVVETK